MLVSIKLGAVYSHAKKDSPNLCYVMEQVDLNKPAHYLFGMRRSGIHVFSDWLMAMGDGWDHYNNVVIRDDNTVESGQVTFHPITTECLDRGYGEGLITFEDYKYSESMEKLPPKPSILLLRDPYNLFASRLQHIRTKDDSPLEMICEDAIKTWKEHAKAFCEYSPYLIVPFNMWYTDEAYRKRICKTLDLPFSDDGFGSKAGWVFSGGSSFGGEPDPMNSYHKNMAEDKEFLSMFDDEVVELARRIFNLEPPANARYDEEFHQGVEKAVTEVLWAVHCGAEDAARNLLRVNQGKYPNSSRLTQLLHYV
jgi:hypothetical protein